MLFGIGIDLVDVTRIKKAINRFGTRFINRIFSFSEQKFCESQSHKYLLYAARFAAKEAFSKALGTGLRGKISWQDIVVIDNDNSPPKLEIKGKAKSLLGNRRTFLSISHTEQYASAVVIIED